MEYFSLIYQEQLESSSVHNEFFIPTYFRTFLCSIIPCFISYCCVLLLSLESPLPPPFPPRVPCGLTPPYLLVVSSLNPLSPPEAFLSVSPVSKRYSYPSPAPCVPVGGSSVYLIWYLPTIVSIPVTTSLLFPALVSPSPVETPMPP